MRWGVEHWDEPALAQRRRGAKRARALGVATASVAGHVVVGLALFAAWAKPAPPVYDPQPITVALVNLPPPAPADPAPPTPAKTAPATAEAHPAIARATAVPTRAASRVAATGQASAPVPSLSDAALAGAATSGSGGEGGCNMARRIEDDLRRDRLVQTAVADFTGRAVMVW